ncbi:MAG TPA: BMP family protein [Phototrophicaceae bacterium]|nr:BMP family protein [Phototrophicaceae bacterium]
MKKILLFVLALVVLSAGVVSAQSSPFKVAIVMPSTINDLSWSQSMYDALTGIQTAMGGADKLEIAYTENMYDVTAAEQAVRDYADQGYNLIIAHGTQYNSFLFNVAADYPNTSFAWGTATDTGESQGLKNIFAYQANAEQGGYVEGVMAAMMSKSGTIGIVGPIPAGDALLYINGFQQGIKATKPSDTILLAYTGGFGDTTAAAQVAKTQIAAGADVLTGSAQQVVGAIDAIQTAGGLWFGTQWDQSGQWPNTVVASQAYDWKPTLTDMISKIQAGTLGGTVYTLTLENKGLIFDYGKVTIPDDVKAAADQAVADIIAGKITVEQDLATPEAVEMTPEAAAATPEATAAATAAS